MLTVNGRKNYTSCGDEAAENLLDKVLSEMHDTLSGTGLSLYLGGSYGRGEGGVRLDKENGILYNDLDFFVFARQKPANGEKLLQAAAEKFESELKVDVDFSNIISVKDIKKNAQRLMMQELKRGYRLVCGEDLLAKYLPEIPAEKLPFSEACRLLLNRGMGLLLAGEKLANKSTDTDFILRNIYKAILGSGDAWLITQGKYCWKIRERQALFMQLDLPEAWKKLYAGAVEFKSSPHRNRQDDMEKLWADVRDFYRTTLQKQVGVEPTEIWQKCRSYKLAAWKNFVKYCLKTRSLPLSGWKIHTAPPVAFLLSDLYKVLESMPHSIDRNSKLYRHWLIFN